MILPSDGRKGQAPLAKRRPDPDPRWAMSGPVDAVGRFPEISLAGLPGVAEGLPIPVKKWEPAALDVDHDTVALED